MLVTKLNLVFIAAIIACITLLIQFASETKNIRFPSYNSYSDSVTITDVNGISVFYSELKGFPHNYLFTLERDTEVYVTVEIPNDKNSVNRHGAIIVKQAKKGGVEEVARLMPESASWQTKRDWVLGESFRVGPMYSGILPIGNYLLEVNTPDNIGRYVLTFGTPGDTRDAQYDLNVFEYVYYVKLFLQKPTVSVLGSPVYYVPLLAFLSVLFYLIYQRKRQKV